MTDGSESLRQDAIYANVSSVLEEMLNESLYWVLPSGVESGGALWHEVRAAIVDYTFAVEHEMGRQEEFSERTREDCV